jgi:hypothetical protein
VLVSLLVLLGSSAIVGPTATAAAPGLSSAATPQAVAAKAKPKSYRGSIVFYKNYRRQFDSKVTWRLWERQGKEERVVEQRSWRAGSGLPRKGGKDPCARSVGWAPSGSYRITLHHDYPGNIIKGRAFRMTNKACKDGTVRQNLFLHTEQGAGNVQCPDRPGDQDCRWEVPKVNDYKSLGCLKMAPGDLRELVRLFDRRFDAGIQYGLDKVVLRVVG